MVSIGIDLGTTNSVAAYYDDEQTHILSSGRPDGLVPSVVTYRKPRPNTSGPGSLLVGQTALDYAITDPTNAVFSIKRLMGRYYSEAKVAATIKCVNYTITPPAGDTDSGVRVRLGETDYTPVQISAMILRHIKENAERVLNKPVTHAVITVPAYFEERQRAATLQAGKEAGFIIKKIIDEPSAAAVAYGYTISRGEPQRLLVFDLGGGTFDVSIIATAKDPKGRNHFETLEISGDNWLGGDDFDREIMSEIFAWVKREYDYDPSEDKVFLLLAKQAAEKAKIALSTLTESEIIIPAYRLPTGQVLNVDIALTRQRFNDLIRHYVEGAMQIVQQALSTVNLRPEHITKVLLVGGSTLVPMVRDLVAQLFGNDKIQQLLSPHHAVALGAGILAGTLKGIECPRDSCRHVNDEASENCVKCGESLAAAPSVGSTSINEPTAFHYGIRTVRGENADAFSIIIKKGTPYPLASPMTKTFHTTAPNFICVPVFEGPNTVFASKNEEQGSIVLDEHFFSTAGVEVAVNTAVEVSMNYSRDRILQVKVRIQGTNVEKEVKLRHDRPRQAPPTQSDDGDWKKSLGMLINVVELFMTKYANMIGQENEARLTRDMDKARETLNGDDLEAVKKAAISLDVALVSCGTASRLFQAEMLKGRVGKDRARRLDEVVAEIKERWYQGDYATVAKLEEGLRQAISAGERMQEHVKEIPDQNYYRGLLRTLDVSGSKE
ncbi:MAG: Hsp70 family protein [Pyrinomonadaceae bacterium]